MNTSRRLLILMVITVIFAGANAFAQAPDTAWTRMHGSDRDDYAYTVLQNADNSYIVGGTTWSGDETEFDAYLLKLDENGDIIWTNTFGVEEGEFIYSMVEASDGGYVVAGMIGSTVDWRNAYIVKVDNEGDTVWSTTYPGSRNAVAHYINRTSDGGYVVTGKQIVVGRNWEVFILKLSQDGAHEWSNLFGGSNADEGHCIQQTADGGYIIGGLTNSFGAGSGDHYLIKTDGAGDLVWSQTYGRESFDAAYAVAQTPDGGYIIAGSINNPDHGIYAVKTNPFGDTLWTRTYTRNTDIDICTSLDLTSDGGYIFGGYSHVPQFHHDFYFVRADAEGDSLWTKTIGFIDYDRGHCVKQTSDGGYIMVGQGSNSGPGGYNCYIVKLNSDYVGIDDNTGLPENHKLMHNYPNPFNATTNITINLRQNSDVGLTIYNLRGQEVETLINGKLSTGHHYITWDASQYSSGIYFYKLSSGDKVFAKRMTLLK
ncbi:MAG: T9SS type A sorting domain-containing protein [candidate division Zixibacteria bacterium]|nr:T9SS type A sorting domain-containing protein [candidate division Zixibacteria bacterium]